MNETGLLNNTGTLLVDSDGTVSLVGTLNDSGPLKIGGDATCAACAKVRAAALWHALAHNVRRMCSLPALMPA